MTKYLFIKYIHWKCYRLKKSIKLFFASPHVSHILKPNSSPEFLHVSQTFEKMSVFFKTYRFKRTAVRVRRFRIPPLAGSTGSSFVDGSKVIKSL